jgi:uncharacterized protein YqgC (DUF456 family)
VLEIIVPVVCVLVMAGATIGSVLPVIPGLPVFFFVYLGYGLFDKWRAYGSAALIVVGAVVVLSLVLDQLAAMLGAKKFGANKAGMIGSVVCAFIGVIFFSLPGLLVGAFLGAAVFEMAFNKMELKDSLKAGGGTLLGLLVGGLFKFMIGTVLTLAFIYQVWLA